MTQKWLNGQGSFSVWNPDTRESGFPLSTVRSSVFGCYVLVSFEPDDELFLSFSMILLFASFFCQTIESFLLFSASSRLPMDPQTGKMILFGAIFSCLVRNFNMQSEKDSLNLRKITLSRILISDASLAHMQSISFFQLVLCRMEGFISVFNRNFCEFGLQTHFEKRVENQSVWKLNNYWVTEIHTSLDFSLSLSMNAILFKLFVQNP